MELNGITEAIQKLILPERSPDMARMLSAQLAMGCLPEELDMAMTAALRSSCAAVMQGQGFLPNALLSAHAVMEGRQILQEQSGRALRGEAETILFCSVNEAYESRFYGVVDYLAHGLGYTTEDLGCGLDAEALYPALKERRNCRGLLLYGGRSRCARLETTAKVILPICRRRGMFAAAVPRPAALPSPDFGDDLPPSLSVLFALAEMLG